MAVGFHSYPTTLPPRTILDLVKSANNETTSAAGGQSARLAMLKVYPLHNEGGGAAWASQAFGAVRKSMANVLRRLADSISPDIEPQ